MILIMAIAVNLDKNSGRLRLSLSLTFFIAGVVGRIVADEKIR